MLTSFNLHEGSITTYWKLNWSEGLGNATFVMDEPESAMECEIFLLSGLRGAELDEPVIIWTEFGVREGNTFFLPARLY